MIKLQEVAQMLGKDSEPSPEIPSFRSQEISIKNITKFWCGWSTGAQGREEGTNV